MTRRVLTYRVPGDLTWKDSVFQKKYVDVIHVVATPTLFESLNEHLKMFRWLNGPVITIGNLLNQILGEKWTSPKAQLKQFLNVSSALNQLWDESNSPTERKILMSFIKNRKETIYTLRVLHELRILSLLNPKSPEEEVLKKLIDRVSSSFELSNWEKWYEKDEKALQKDLNDYFNKTLNSVEELEKHNILMDDYKVEEIVQHALKKRQIILHGFYFITPLQEYFFNILEAHYDLIFVNTYDERFPGTFEIVEDFLRKGSVEWKPSLEEPCRINPLAANLLNSFEGELENFHKLNFKAQRFTDMSDFILHEKQKLNENRPYVEYTVTSRGGLAREHLYQSGILKKKNRSLLEYPIGRFLFSLLKINHDEWNPETGEYSSFIALSPQILKELFASGYVINKSENGFSQLNMIDYLKSLEMLSPYFKLGDGFRKNRGSDELKIEEWLEGINEIIKEKEIWSEGLKVPTSRNHRFHSKPFEQLSYFKVDLEDLNIIKNGIFTIKNMSEELFGKGNNVEITSYIKKLKEYAEISLGDDLINDEKLVVENLIKKINELSSEKLMFKVTDIAAGLQFFLQSGLPKVGEDEENQIERMGGLFIGDGMPFKRDRNIHLAFADNKALPSAVTYKLWPLGEDSINDLSIAREELKLFQKHSYHAGSMNRYLLYSMFSSANRTRISFVEDVGEESRLELATYFKLINLDETLVSVEKKWMAKETTRILVGPFDRATWTELMEEDYADCQKRAIFNYVLNDYGSYENEFHHSHIYERLLQAAYEGLKNWNSAIESISPLFPQFSEEYKLFILNQVRKKRGKNRSGGFYNVDGYMYSKVLRKVKFLEHQYPEEELFSGHNENTSLAAPGYKCRYCAFIDVCREGVYSKDYESARK